MISLVLVLFSAFEMPVFVSAGFVFPESWKTHTLIGTVYTGHVECQVFRIKEAYFGISGNLFMKRSSPYASDYFKNPQGKISLACYGIGPSFAWAPRKTVRIDLEYSLDYISVRYPESASNSQVTTASVGHVVIGIGLAVDFLPVSLGNYRLGLKGGLNVLGYGTTYYYLPAYEDHEVFDQMSITGMFIKMLIARW